MCIYMYLYLELTHRVTQTLTHTVCIPPHTTLYHFSICSRRHIWITVLVFTLFSVYPHVFLSLSFYPSHFGYSVVFLSFLQLFLINLLFFLFSSSWMTYSPFSSKYDNKRTPFMSVPAAPHSSTHLLIYSVHMDRK